MAKLSRLAIAATLIGAPFAHATCPYDPNCLNNPYGAGSPYRADGLNNPYSPYGSPFSNRSATNPYATDAPKLYDSEGNYRGRLSTNPTTPTPPPILSGAMAVRTRPTASITPMARATPTPRNRSTSCRSGEGWLGAVSGPPRLVRAVSGQVVTLCE